TQHALSGEADVDVGGGAIVGAAERAVGSFLDSAAGGVIAPGDAAQNRRRGADDRGVAAAGLFAAAIEGASVGVVAALELTGAGSRCACARQADRRANGA